MIKEITMPDGRQAFVCTFADLTALNTWARALCHLAFGPEKGEAHYRKIPVRAVLALWSENVTAS